MSNNVWKVHITHCALAQVFVPGDDGDEVPWYAVHIIPARLFAGASSSSDISITANESSSTVKKRAVDPILQVQLTGTLAAMGVDSVEVVAGSGPD